MRAMNVILCGFWMSACDDARKATPGVEASAKGVATGLSLSIPAPTAESEVDVTLRPGDPFLFQGSFFSVKGATPKALRRSTPVVRAGDVIAIESRRGAIRYTAVALSSEGQLLVIPQADSPDAGAVFAFGDGLISSPGAVSDCLQQLSTASISCITQGSGSACCQDQYDAHWSYCLTTASRATMDDDYGTIWAESCDGGGTGDDTGGGGGDSGGGVGPWDDTGGTACGPETEEVTDQEVTVNGVDCTYSGPVHSFLNEDGECVTTIDPDEGVLTCGDDDSGSGGRDDDTALNFPVGEAVGAGG